jgi:peptide deformylase
MAILKVAKMGHPVLRTKAQSLSPKEIRSPENQLLIDNMVETMREYDGVGLAGPQVHESKRIFVVEVVETSKRGEVPLTVLINPIIKPLSNEKALGWEGCLSIPDMRGMVPRYKEIEVSALDGHGKELNFKAKDFFAVVIQHETDHLDGILFLDRMQDFSTLTYLNEYAKYWAKD